MIAIGISQQRARSGAPWQHTAVRLSHPLAGGRDGWTFDDMTVGTIDEIVPWIARGFELAPRNDETLRVTVHFPQGGAPAFLEEAARQSTEMFLALRKANIDSATCTLRRARLEARILHGTPAAVQAKIKALLVGCVAGWPRPSSAAARDAALFALFPHA